MNQSVKVIIVTGKMFWVKHIGGSEHPKWRRFRRQNQRDLVDGSEKL